MLRMRFGFEKIGQIKRRQRYKRAKTERKVRDRARDKEREFIGVIARKALM